MHGRNSACWLCFVCLVCPFLAKFCVVVFFHWQFECNFVAIFFKKRQTTKSEDFKFFKMMPLKTNRRVLMWLCVWPSSQVISIWKKIGYIIFALSVFGFAVYPITLDIGLLMMSLHTGDLETSFQAIYQMSVSANIAYACTYACILIFVLRNKINDIFEELIKIYDARKRSPFFI